MARINGLIGTNLTGSAGKLTFTMVNGQNIMKQKATVVKNPRTFAQQTQRMKFNSVTNAYSRTQSITNHSFTGIAYGAQSMNYFKSKASPIIANGNSFAARGTEIIPLGIDGIVISKGNLSGQLLQAPGYSTIDELPRHMYIGGDVKVNATTTTVAQLLGYLGLKKGQQFTYIGIGSGAAGGYGALLNVGPNKVQPIKQKTVTASFVIKTTAADTALAFVATEDAGIFTLNPAVIDTENSQGYEKLHWDTTYLLTNLTNIQHDDCMATDYEACIISEQVNGVWDRSNEVLNPTYNMLIHGIVGTQELTFDAETVMNTYNPASPYYLNNAEV